MSSQKNPAAVALGSIRSEKKAASSRANGRKGGRPVFRDQNGNKLSANVKLEHIQLPSDSEIRLSPVWGRTVWSGGLLNGLSTNVRRYYYATREEAKRGDISDDIGRSGRVA